MPPGTRMAVGQPATVTDLSVRTRDPSRLAALSSNILLWALAPLFFFDLKYRGTDIVPSQIAYLFYLAGSVGLYRVHRGARWVAGVSATLLAYSMFTLFLPIQFGPSGPGGPAAFILQTGLVVGLLATLALTSTRVLSDVAIAGGAPDAAGPVRVVGRLAAFFSVGISALVVLLQFLRPSGGTATVFGRALVIVAFLLMVIILIAQVATSLEVRSALTSGNVEKASSAVREPRIGRPAATAGS